MKNFLIVVEDEKKQYIEIKGYIDDQKGFMDGYGYIDRTTGYIYIFNSTKSYEPSFNYDGTGSLVYSIPKESYHISALEEEPSVEQILENTDLSQETLSKEAKERMANATKIYTPNLKQSDDFLKQAIKLIIIDKNIDMNRLRSEVDKPHMISNKISALEGPTGTTAKAYNEWKELLKYDFTLTVRDSGTDNINPMNHTLTYDSATDEWTDEDGNEIDLESLSRETREKKRNGGI